MKRTITLFISLFILAGFAIAQNDTIAKWTFPTGTAEDANPDLSSPLNVDQTVFTVGGTGAIDFSKNGETTKAATANGWEDGMDTKSWQITLNTTGYENLKLSSMLTAGGNDPGPRDYKLQYKIGESGTWIDILDGNITVANDWTTGVVEALNLPTECYDEELVYISWIMTSNTDAVGGTVIEAGKAKIDNIIVVGDVATRIDGENQNEFAIYPNPSNGIVNIETDSQIENICIFDLTGKQVFESSSNSTYATIELTSLSKGIYIFKVITVDNNVYTRKITVK